MALTHTQTVDDLVILNNADKVVSEVTVKTVSVDDDDAANLTIESRETYHLDTTLGISTSTFVAYDSLTQDTVLGWITSELGSSNVKINHESWISSVKNPPAPTQVSEALPW